MYSPSKKTSTHSVLPGMAVPVGRFLHTHQSRSFCCSSTSAGGGIITHSAPLSSQMGIEKLGMVDRRMPDAAAIAEGSAATEKKAATAQNRSMFVSGRCPTGTGTTGVNGVDEKSMRVPEERCSRVLAIRRRTTAGVDTKAFALCTRSKAGMARPRVTEVIADESSTLV